MESSPLLSCQPSRGDAEWQAFLSRLWDVLEVWQTSTIFYLYVELEKLQDGFHWEKRLLPGELWSRHCWSCLSVLQGDTVVQAGKSTAQLGQSYRKNFHWLHGLSCVTVMAIVVSCNAYCASVCLGNDNGCFLPTIWLASKCDLKKCGRREKYSLCKCCLDLLLFFCWVFCLFVFCLEVFLGRVGDFFVKWWNQYSDVAALSWKEDIRDFEWIRRDIPVLLLQHIKGPVFHVWVLDVTHCTNFTSV